MRGSLRNSVVCVVLVFVAVMSMFGTRARAQDIRSTMDEIMAIQIKGDDGSYALIFWNGGEPVMIADGEVLETVGVVTENEQDIQFVCVAGTGKRQRAVLTSFSFGEKDDVVVGFSNLDGTDATRMVVSVSEGEATMDTCVCFKNSSVACTQVQCNNNTACVTTPSGEERAWCENRTQSPDTRRQVIIGLEIFR